MCETAVLMQMGEPMATLSVIHQALAFPEPRHSPVCHDLQDVFAVFKRIASCAAPERPRPSNHERRNPRMHLTDTLLTILCALIGLAIGLIYGLLPKKNDRMTDSQQRWIPVLSLIGPGLVVVMILLGHDLASWLTIGGMFLGLLLGMIPPLNRALLKVWPWVRPRTDNQGRKRR